MTRQELENWLIGRGYVKNQFGHYHKTLNGKEYRFKMQDNSTRYERQARIVDHNEWLRIKSGYYKNLSITPDDNLAGLK